MASNHLFTLLETVKGQGVPHTYIHFLGDGRDTAPRSATKYVEQLLDFTKKLGHGEIALDIPLQDWMLPQSADMNSAADVGTSNLNFAAFSYNTAPGHPPSGPGQTSLPLGQNTVLDIMALTHHSISWKTCIKEGTSWDRTAQENIEKYKKSVELY